MLSGGMADGFLSSGIESQFCCCFDQTWRALHEETGGKERPWNVRPGIPFSLRFYLLSSYPLLSFLTATKRKNECLNFLPTPMFPWALCTNNRRPGWGTHFLRLHSKTRRRQKKEAKEGKGGGKDAHASHVRVFVSQGSRAGEEKIRRCSRSTLGHISVLLLLLPSNFSFRTFLPFFTVVKAFLFFALPFLSFKAAFTFEQDRDRILKDLL